MSDKPVKKETIKQKRTKLMRTNHIEEYDLEGFKQQQLVRQQKESKKLLELTENDISKKEY